MGTSGNKPGYKVFSISTTIRNPIRNPEFLEVLQEFDNTELTKDIKNKIYVELIRKGIYQVNNLDNIIKEKYEENILLEDEEILRIIEENPQKTGNEGRLMTQIRAIKDAGFINLIGPQNKKTLQITPLGKRILNDENIEDIYSKAMIGLHANNPQRTTMFNKSRPFLNTLFIINEINKKFENNKGILKHEFAFFVLPMKDCDYNKAVEEIIKYREKFGNKINKEYLENYLYNILKLNNKISFKSINRDYADDVFRKFNMTGLIGISGFSQNTYIRFNSYNINKIKALLSMYKDYKFEEFHSTDEYTEYLNNIELPWEISEELKMEMIKYKQGELKVELEENITLDDKIKKLDEIYNKKVFDNYVQKTNIDLMKNELLILSNNQNKKSKFGNIPEPVRLEWFIALITAKIYGTEYVKPNLKLDTNGIPKSYASGGKADIEFISKELYCLIEVTMQRDYRQQENNETTSITDHLRKLNVDKEKCSLLIAPRIHSRVVDYFKYSIYTSKMALLALTIEVYIDIIEKNSSVKEFREAVMDLVKYMNEEDIQIYSDKINGFKIENK